MWEDTLSECRIRGWIAVSATGLQGEGLRKRNVFSDTGIPGLMQYALGVEGVAGGSHAVIRFSIYYHVFVFVFSFSFKSAI